jgi:tRNA-specific 2-thiouridylase
MAKLNGIDFDKFATGHYARIEKSDDRYLLKRGIAPRKDQSYFLYRLKQEQLSQIILPLGGYTKEEIRQIAKDNGLNVAEKPDSQDFYDGDYNELLGIEEKEGNFVDTNGKILGTHKGFWNYTIGQRKGIGISSTEPLYVLELRKATNEVVIGPADKTFKKSLKAINLNWIATDTLKDTIKAQAKIRSTQQPVPVTVIPEENSVRVVFDELQKSIAIGQSVVLYDNDIVLGGGVIDEVE